MLPLLEHVLPFLKEIHLKEELSAAHAIEVCLSASYYTALDWKAKIMAVAENIGKRFPVGNQLRESIGLRKRILFRISYCKWWMEGESLGFTRDDQRSNGYYGEFCAFQC